MVSCVVMLLLFSFPWSIGAAPVQLHRHLTWNGIVVGILKRALMEVVDGCSHSRRSVAVVTTADVRLAFARSVTSCGVCRITSTSTCLRAGNEEPPVRVCLGGLVWKHHQFEGCHVGRGPMYDSLKPWLL